MVSPGYKFSLSALSSELDSEKNLSRFFSKSNDLVFVGEAIDGQGNTRGKSIMLQIFACIV